MEKLNWFLFFEKYYLNDDVQYQKEAFRYQWIQLDSIPILTIIFQVFTNEMVFWKIGMSVLFSCWINLDDLGISEDYKCQNEAIESRKKIVRISLQSRKITFNVFENSMEDEVSRQHPVEHV